VRHELPDDQRGALVWPVLAGLLRNIVEVEPEYVVEGDVLVPARIAEFAAAREGQVRSCFLGYSRGTAEAKRASIRSFPSAVNDWVAGTPDRELAGLVTEMQEFSRYVEAECEKCGLAYFDTGASFNDGLGKAEVHLLQGGS
jgi:hypothetical protein